MRWISWKHRFSHTLARSLTHFHSYLPLFPSLVNVIVVAHFCCTYCSVHMCVCMPHSLKVDRLVLFATFAEKPRLNADFLVFASPKSNTMPQNNRTFIHTHTRSRARQHVMRIPNFRMDELELLSTIVTGHRRYSMTFTQCGFKLPEIGLSFTFTSCAKKN